MSEQKEATTRKNADSGGGGDSKTTKAVPPSKSPSRKSPNDAVATAAAAEAATPTRIPIVNKVMDGTRNVLTGMGLSKLNPRNRKPSGGDDDDHDNDGKDSGTPRRQRNWGGLLMNNGMFRRRGQQVAATTTTETRSEPDLLDDDDDDARISRELSALSDVGDNPMEYGELDDLDSSIGSASAGGTILLSPTLEVLTEDTTIAFMVVLSIAAYPTYTHWTAVLEDQIPLSVTGSWLLVAFFGGQFLASSGISLKTLSAARSVIAKTRPNEIVYESRPQYEKQMARKIVEQDKIRRHSILFSSLGRSRRIKFEAVAKPIKKASMRVWTTLNAKHMASQPREWTRTCDPTKTDTGPSALMNRLVKNHHFVRVKKAERMGGFDKSGRKSVRISVPAVTGTSSIGSMDLSAEPDTILQDYVILPFSDLRGMDVFMTEDAETEVCTHPWLMQQGLRDVPTVVVNVVTQWASVLIYFQLPDWCDDFSELVEAEDDTEDVKAVKRFLKGDDDYRNARLKVVPSVAEGPLAVRLLAPPKREIVVNCESLPVRWIKHDAGVSPSGRKLKPALEMEIDCVSGRAIRGMASILKRNLASLAIDVAVVVSKPEEQEEDEPEVCVGMFRFNHIDVEQCPRFPDRFAEEAAAKGQNSDVIRASKMMHLSTAEMSELLREEFGDEAQ